MGLPVNLAKPILLAPSALLLRFSFRTRPSSSSCRRQKWQADWGSVHLFDKPQASRTTGEETQRLELEFLVFVVGRSVIAQDRLWLKPPSSLDSSPIRYVSSSSPGRALNSQGQENNLSSSSGLFVRSSAPTGPSGPRLNSSRRGDIHSEHLGSTAGNHGPLFVDEHGVPVRGGAADSETGTFSQVNPNTSDADILGGGSTRVIWGTNVSIQDTMASFQKFLLNYTKKYRMWADGASEAETAAQPEVSDQKEYVDMMRNMRILGMTGLNLDVRNLKAYPPTVKLWHQLQSYPQEVIPLMDQLVKDVMVEEAAKEISGQRARERQRPLPSQVGNGIPSSEPVFPSSERNHEESENTGPPSEVDLLADVESRVYKIRPFGLDQTINLRELNPTGNPPTPLIFDVSYC